MEEFASKAVLDTKTSLTHIQFKEEGCFAAVLSEDYTKGIAEICYGFEDLQDKGQKQVRKDITSRCKMTKGFADITLTILHEIGHFANEQITRSYDRQQAIKRLYREFPLDIINFEYFKLPDEKAATDWAIAWLSIPENRKTAKNFEKKFFSCFK